MTLRAIAILLVVGTLGLVAWRSTLFTVEKRGAHPEVLSVRPVSERRVARVDASLPVVPVGVERVRANGEIVIVHYWAPWERHSGPQALALDSLRRTLPPGAVRLAVVCFDPYPSVSRYVARMRLRLPVLLDLQHALADQLPCPSIPYTYVLDRSGRIAIEQAGEVDWLAPATRAALERLIAEPAAEPAPARTAS